MSKLTTQDIKLHSLHNRALFILGKSGPQLKKPYRRGWTTVKHTATQLLAAVAKGHNLAWRLGPTDMVIDIDPRHGGMESWARLEPLLQPSEQTKPVPLVDLAPTVQTGSSGLHIYLTLPPDPTSVKANNDKSSRPHYRETLPEYPGIEFKKQGRYVLIAHCLHPNGRYYEYHPMSPYTDKPPLAPQALLDLLIYRSVQTPWEAGTEADLLPNELNTVLGQIDPLNFRESGDQWQKLLFAVHYATHGSPIARDIFIDWCIKDPQYLHDGSIIAQRWDSLHYDKDALITTASLRRYCAKVGITWPRAALTRTDVQAIKDTFADSPLPPTPPLPEPTSAPEPPPLLPAPIAQPAPATTPLPLPPSAPLPPPPAQPPIYQVLLDEISVLSPGDPTLGAKLDHYIEQGLSMGVVALEAIKAELKRSLGLRTKATDRLEQDVRNRIKKAEQLAERSTYDMDPDLLVAQSLLVNRFSAGRQLLHAPNQQFYYYDSTHWQPLLANILTKTIFDEAEKLKTQSLSLDFKTTPLIPRVEVVLKARTAQAIDLLGFAQAPKPIYNTLNTEVHLDTQTGSTALKAHTPESYLNYCLNTTYDPAATAPLFDRFLNDLFEPLAEPQAAISTIEEILGYVMQPYKPSNGKTSLLDIVSALVGPDNVLPRSVLEFGNTGRNNHAFA
ncbi:MAG: bifunctional DNA primase/polymerase, partial [Planctomycetota bacterium]